MLRRCLPLCALSLAFLSLPGCEEAGDEEEHQHNWQEGETPSAPASSGTSSSPGGGGSEDSGQTTAGGAQSTPEPTIVHATLGPEDLARHYLMLASAGDLSRISEFVEPPCYRGPVGRVDAVRLVGSLMILKALTLKVESESQDRATVHFHLIGGLNAGEKKTEISIEGEELGEKVVALSAQDVEREGRLNLTRVDGLWRVTCGFAYETAESALKGNYEQGSK